MIVVFVDADLLISCIRPLNPAKPEKNKILQRARDVMEDLFATNDHVNITLYTLAELYKGVYKSQQVAYNLRLVEKYLARFELVLPNVDSAKEYARLSADLESKGQIIGIMDILIASCIISNDEILYTRNVDHFNRIPGLNLVNWAID
jgi:tRNA(fMet)-specific endonuclease VapC